MIFLSYVLNTDTPTYGNRNNFEQVKKSDMSKGDVANDTSISTTVHIGTHIDMPYHFFEDGQTIKDFDADFWVFKKPLIIEIKQDDLVINKQLINKLNKINNIGYDILIVKTGICDSRENKEFWNENYGFHPDVYDFLATKFPSIRVFGFDSISVSSIQNRMMGREAHKKFLNPKKPILLLEDMDLRNIDENTIFKEILVSPLRIADCDGLPCTVFGRLND
ncbi:MAG: cyclase family protein [Sulfurimonas sp.]|nr:cyclase family protein [Sulfurimonas sp.]